MVIPLLKKPLVITGRAKDVKVSFIGSVTSSPTRKVTAAHPSVPALPMGIVPGWCQQLPLRHNINPGLLYQRRHIIPASSPGPRACALQATSSQ